MADIRFVSKADAKAIVQAAALKYTNQNAIGVVKVGADTFTAEEAVDQIELIAGENVQVSISNAGAITISATDTTYGDATQSVHGLMSTEDKAKLDGIAAGAEANQNAFSNVAVGAQTLAADSKTDTLTLSAGSNVTITPNASDDSIEISATDTTYTLEQDQANGHVITFTPSNGQPTSITIPDSDTTYGDVVADATGAADSGLMTSADKAKLDGVADGAQANVLESVQVNGTALTPTNKAVNVTVTTGDSGVGTIKVNGSSVSVYGLGGAAAADVSQGVADGDTGLVTGDQVYDYVAGVVSSAYKAAGSIAPAGVTGAILVAANAGKVYNLSAALTLDATTAALFVDGTAGETFPEGTNIVVVDDNGSTKFDVLAGFVDLSGYALMTDLGGLTQAELEEVIAEL